MNPFGGPEDDVEVSVIALGAPVPEALLARTLSPAEQDRAARLREGPGREAFVTTRIALRQILAGHLGLQPSAVPLAQREGGKPILDPAAGCADLRFNVSHSRGIALCAVAFGREVGIDVEWMDPGTPWQAIAAAQFSAQELGQLMALPLPARRPAFFAMWTRKEARLKGQGTGFARLAPTMEDLAGPWAEAALDIGPEHAAALGVQSSVLRYQLRPWPMQSAA